MGRIVGRENMIQSSVWSEARKEGLKEGRLEARRELCLRMVREYHPALVAPATAAIQACADPVRLAEWIVSAPRLTDDEFSRLLSIK